ncbi:hypothetical protein GSI_12450 [Ganoderma sinense ZZ0214-1]|uniref:Fungal-type protein kinase domain-containing protein n=1 Tax=Ganoderma sinense ZZ0214-1 TaxID=1077348 RepID=A0A2G8RSS4_9APHY|nr:hypothetical protein GSI_12450 [Ganoderma sinense ZZ0214-1]
MDARFHLLDNDAFAGRIPGALPSDAERKGFKSPKLKKGMLERDIYLQLGAVVQSVLEAAECTKLQFLDNAHHKSKDGNHEQEKSPAQLKERLPEARSSFWVEVPVEVKGDEKNSAFYFKSKPKPKGFCDQSDQPAAVESQEGGRLQEEKEEAEVVEDANQAKKDEDVEAKDEDRGDQGLGDRDSEAERKEEKGVGDGGDDDSDDSGDSAVGEDDEGSESGDWRTPEDSKPSTRDAALSFLKTYYPPFVNVSHVGIKALDQFIERQLNIFRCQHRTFCYSIYICFDMARLLYFDRAGAYVSHPFSWVERTSLLHEFVWKFAQFANADKLGKMGHDPTATVVSAETRQKFIKQAKNAALARHIRAGLKKASEDGCPLYELVVQDVAPSPDEWFSDEPFPELPTSPSSDQSGDSSSGDTTATVVHRFIVGRPHFSADTLVGRCTRGYMAFDVTDPKKWVPCFLKDSWRRCVPHRTRPEHSVYERLKRKGLKPTDGIATLICGGDVGGFRAQRTRVQQKDLSETNKPVRLIHYRLVTEDIGLPLSEFDNFSELSGIFVGALRGHRKAWDLAGILHGDISVGNIMIRVHSDGTRSGFLIDWDLSRLACELFKGPVKRNPIGTWQFRSALSLQYPRKPYRRSDDIESFIHVYLYLVLRYHPTCVVNLRNEVQHLFGTRSPFAKETQVGGSAKLMTLMSGYLGFMVIGNARLQRLLDDILHHCRMAYKHIDTSAMSRLYGPVPQSGPDAHHDMPPKSSTPRLMPSVLRPSDFPDTAAWLDHLHGRARRLFPREDARSAASAPPEPYEPEVGPFLSKPRTLMNLFIEHAESEAYKYDDKAPDQFVFRTAPGNFWPSEFRQLRSVGTPSVAGSFESEDDKADPNARSSDSDVATAADARVTVVGHGGGQSESSGSTADSKRKHAEKHGEKDGEIEEDEEQGSAVHCKKRTRQDSDST